jgi:hypothetical protein
MGLLPQSNRRLCQQPYHSRTSEADADVHATGHRRTDLGALRDSRQVATPRRWAAAASQGVRHTQTACDGHTDIPTQGNTHQEAACRRDIHHGGAPRAWAAGDVARGNAHGRRTHDTAQRAHVGGQEADVPKDAHRHGADDAARRRWQSATGARSPVTWRREGRAFACSASRGQLALATCHDAICGARRCQAHACLTAQRRTLAAGPMPRPQSSHNQPGASTADNKHDGNGLLPYASASLHHDAWG